MGSMSRNATVGGNPADHAATIRPDTIKLLTIAAQSELGAERARRFVAAGIAALGSDSTKPEARGLCQAEVARMLGCSRWSVRRLVAGKKLTPRRLLGGLVRFDRREVEALIAGGVK